MDGEVIVLYRVKDPNATVESDRMIWSTTNPNDEGIGLEFVLPFGFELRKTQFGAHIVNFITGDFYRLVDSPEGMPMLTFPGIDYITLELA
jgi:hypothetical protein